MECGMTDPNVSDADRELMSAKSRVNEATVQARKLRSLLTAARAYVSREASGVGGAEARALIGEIDGVLGQ